MSIVAWGSALAGAAVGGLEQSAFTLEKPKGADFEVGLLLHFRGRA